MNSVLIIANLKSYKNEIEAKAWIDEVIKNREILENLEGKEIVVCPPFTLLPLFYSSFSNTKIKLGSQNMSPFDEGAYTGEVNAKQIKDFAEYVIIGHSERRNFFGETEEMIVKKTELAEKYDLTPIVCVQTKETKVPEGIKIIAYEPVFAIGSGNPDTPQNASEVAHSFLDKNLDYSILYGGSVTSQNVSGFTKEEFIKGVLVGGASLDPLEFIKIIENA
jgi:triosephosphate isomerase (TIM)